MSRLLLLCVAVSWLVWLLLSPLAWIGCGWRLELTLNTVESVRVHVVAAPDMDLTKITTVYAKVSGAESDEQIVPKPAQGWPQETEYLYSPDTDGLIVFTITAYDASNRLIGLGRGESQKYSDVEIVVQSTIPWN